MRGLPHRFELSRLVPGEPCPVLKLALFRILEHFCRSVAVGLPVACLRDWLASRGGLGYHQLDLLGG